MEDLITQLLGNGPIGLVAAISLYFAYQKDKEVKALYEQMVQREEKKTEWMTEIYRSVDATVRLLKEHVPGQDNEGSNDS